MIKTVKTFVQSYNDVIDITTMRIFIELKST